LAKVFEKLTFITLATFLIQKFTFVFIKRKPAR